MVRLLSTYILKEIFIPFLLCVVILTSTVILSKTFKLVELVVSSGVGMSFIFWFIIATIPTFMIYIMPIAFLISILIAYSRMGADNEVIAMKAAGISLFSQMKPILFFAFLIFIILLGITTRLNPWGNNAIKHIMLNVAKVNTSAGIEEQIFYNHFKGVVLYVDRVPARGAMMQGIFVSQADSAGGETMIFAKRGFFVPSPENLSVSLILEDGTMQMQGAGGDPAKGANSAPFHFVRFARYSLGLTLKAANDPTLARRPNRELYISDLRKKIRLDESEGRSSAQEVVDLHKRFALPVAVFIFALLGVPLGMQRIRSSGLTGFSVSLGVVLLYFTLSKILEGLGENASINPIAAVWGTNIVLGLLGLYIFHKTAKDSPIKGLEWINSLLCVMSDIVKKAFHIGHSNDY